MASLAYIYTNYYHGKYKPLYTAIDGPTNTPAPSILPPKDTQILVPLSRNSNITKTNNSLSPTPTPLTEWGKAIQVDDHTWTIRVQNDDRMAIPAEIFAALNSYRQSKGSSHLNWDNKLADYAQSRAEYFDQIKNVDGHKGFSDYLENQDGFNKLGFNELGENASFGYRMYGVHLIEWIYAGDEPHNLNQLNNKWNYVGIGVKGTATCLIFGTGKF